MKEHFEQTDESLARLRGPIGIYIGSKLPSEIAVSIMAEILAVKNGVKLPREMEVAAAKDELNVLPNEAESGLICQRMR
jgi:xanthine dehydrogenase accessory factor